MVKRERSAPGLRRGAGPFAAATLAPAKVNLVLRVGPLRADGFHDLATLMVPLDLADRVSLRVTRGRPGAVTCRVPGRPDLDGASNLAARAAEAFRRRFGVTEGADIRIEKRIPVTAGLGGGSSDAAAVLRLLARAHGVRDHDALRSVAAEVGSDVPFFLGPGPAWATGRGERLATARVPRLDLLLLYPRHPAQAIRAAEAYRWLDEDRAGRAPVRPPRPLRGPFTSKAAANDLQGPALERRPEVAALLRDLVGHGASAAIMSGSGPTVFGIFANRASAARAARMVRETGGETDVAVHVVRTVQRQPGVSPWKSPRSASSRSTKRS